jgi:uncharacterized membrane protein
MNGRKSFIKHVDNYDQVSGLSLERIKALSDGVFAISLTLLVLDISIPVHDQIKNESDLANAFVSLSPKLLTYFLSFVTLGIFWTAHTSHLHYMEKSDRNFNWLNLFFLLFITTMPFTTAFLSEFIHFKFAIGLYWLNLFIIGAMLFGTLHYGLQHHLFQPYVAAKNEIIKAMKKRGIVAQALYATGAALSFVSTYLSLAILITVQLFFVFGLSKTGSEKIRPAAGKSVDPDRNAN